MPVVNISDAGRYDGQEITLRGWLYNMRESGKLLFPQFRDGTGVLQGVVSQKETPEAFEALRNLTQESSLIVTGKLRGDKRAPGGFEMDVTHVETSTENSRSNALSDSTERTRRRFPARPAALVDSFAETSCDSADSRRMRSRCTKFHG